ncbi:hypothetical protein ABGY98_003045 [Salmonella enterica]|uniref:Uncharacterized protein n=1 Tax=Salmonella enterica TaxID=28901 RepID=A0A629KD31_SALER|nr:hypothetical protein [Salmonella enterica]AXC68426.1 hypothetical protein DOE63_25010 [Salmonella enterica subsp. diarizonae serovar 59:z10:-]EBK2664480.1 hypothetical protein [Salmonella enterica subsp. enterica serovar Enteritidis]EBV5861708.1 hypothetical protein [Salmonella enterica subsp. enterica serovar Bere]ECI0840967.1 hypothetical protein [Salmonella enterica subsp. diarizonae]EDW1489059.1 hypothetical protein [Salmonella enterica subsp. enterica serovar Hvittingfoss]MCH5483259.1
MKKILCVLAGVLSITTAHADYLRDIQTSMQKANTGTDAVTLWNVYRMTDSEGSKVVCGFVKGFDDTGHFMPFLYKNGELFLNNSARPDLGQQTYLASPCSHTSSPV